MHYSTQIKNIWGEDVFELSKNVSAHSHCIGKRELELSFPYH